MITINSQGFYLNEQGQFVDANGALSSVPVKAEIAQQPKQEFNQQAPVVDENLREDAAGLTPDQIQEMIQTAVAQALQVHTKNQSQSFGLKDLAAAVSDGISTANQRNNRIIGRAPVREEEIDVDDYLQEAVVYYAYSQTFWIFDDIRKGQPVLTPYGKPIKFHNFVRTKKTTANSKYDGGVIAICRAEIRSKKQAAWLEKHSLFNIRFFKTVDQAQNVSVLFAEKLKEAESQVSRVEYDVIEKAKSLGLPLTTDIASLRSQVVYTMAQVFMAIEKQRAYVPESDFSKEEKIKKTSAQFKKASVANY